MKPYKKSFVSFLLVAALLSQMIFPLNANVPEQNRKQELIAAWNYGDGATNALINGALTANRISEPAYRANGGENSDGALMSARLFTVNERQNNHALVGSASYISYGTSDTFPALRTGDYYQFSASTTGKSDVTFSLDMRLTAGSPGDFRLWYSLDGNNFINSALVYNRNTALDVGNVSFALPEACWNQSLIYLRIVIDSNRGRTSANISASGSWGVDNIIFSDGEENEIASWKYGGDGRTNAIVNSALNANLTAETTVFRANDGAHKENSFLSARKFSTNERKTDFNFVGSSGFISFGTNAGPPPVPNLQPGDYIQFQTSTLDYEKINFGFDMRLTAGSPGDFKLLYGTNGFDFFETGLTYRRTSAPDIARVSFELPESCANKETLFLRLVIASDARRDTTGVLTTTATIGIDNIEFNGFSEEEDDDDPPVNNDPIELAAWKYGDGSTANASVTAALNANRISEPMYGANGGVNAEGAFLSARLFNVGQRQVNHTLLGSVSYISFGTQSATANTPAFPQLREDDFYQFRLSTLGFSEINLSLDMRLTAGSPGNFKLQYSYDGENFSDTGLTYSRTIAEDVRTVSFDLPQVCDNIETLFLRLTIVGNTARNGAAITGAGSWGIDDIVFSDAEGTEIVFWRYGGENRTNATINASINANLTAETTVFRANSGVNMETAFLSARKNSTNAKLSDFPLRGSSGFISFGTEPDLTEGDYYQFQLSTKGYDNVNMSLLMRLTSRAPGDFILLYSLDGTNYSDTGLTLRRLFSGTAIAANFFLLPEECWDEENLFLRLAITGNRSQGGSTIAETGTWGIDNIVFNSGMSDAFLSQYLEVEVVTPDELIQRGNIADVQVKIKNISAFDMDEINVRLNPPYFAVLHSGAEQEKINIEAGQTVTLNYSYYLLQGGREAFYAVVEKSGVHLTAQSGVSVSGAGYFSGDNHTHSLWSDGSGTIEQNVNEAYYNKMLSWLYSTDHNTMRHLPDANAQTTRFDGRFVNLAASEFTAYNGHVLTLGYGGIVIGDEEVPYEINAAIARASDMTGGAGASAFNSNTILPLWQNILDGVKERGGMTYVAHPFSANHGFGFRPIHNANSDATLAGILGHTGFEVWNAGSGAYGAERTLLAFDAWDMANSRGGRYFAMATSDAHSVDNMGRAYTKAFLPTLSAKNIDDVLRNGNYFNSDGAEIRFNIDGTQIGGTHKVPAEQQATFNLNIFSPQHDLREVRIVRNTVSGNYVLNRDVVFARALTGTKVFDEKIILSVKPGEFYRVEISCERSLTNPSQPGNAFTNNIWIEQGTSSATNISDVNYSGNYAQIRTLPTGIMYLWTQDGAVIDLENLTANISSGASLEKIMNEKIITLRVTALDGTVSDTNIYLLEASPFFAETLTLSPGSSERDVNFTWYSADSNGTMSLVQIAPKANVSSEGIFPTVGVLTAINTSMGDAVFGRTWHKASAIGLQRNTEYVYRVSVDGIRFSNMYEFKIGAAGSFRFIAVGDPQLTTGMQDEDSFYPIPPTTVANGWLNTVNKFMQHSPNARFILSAGDQVDTTGGDEYEYTNLFAPSALRGIRFAPVMGNHDRHINFDRHFNLPNVTQNVSGLSQTDALSNYWYRYNNALFVALNTSASPTAATIDNYARQFDETLKAATEANPDAEWIFVQHHKSTTSPATHSVGADVAVWRSVIGDLMDKYNVDFVISGHDHAYSRSHRIFNGEAVDADAPHGTVYFTLNSSSGLKYYDLVGDPWYADMSVQVKAPQFTTVDVSKNAVLFTTYRVDTMAAIDTFTFSKNNGDADDDCDCNEPSCGICFDAPPTGILDITAYAAAMVMLFAVAAISWGIIIRRRKHARVR
ncbi:MAG: CehA/McbA family metallohydrolase [Defluviitaleaceae bacterium]|nr:CehA/McbA family metallohydrolase [Defluviitaleaceae bacterium]